MSATDRWRLFVALELPAEVRSALVAWRPRLDGLRSLDPEALHVTLCFLGSRPAGMAGAIGAACSAALAGVPSCPLALGDALWLPRRRPGVLAVRVLDRDARLATLQAGLSAALVALGQYEPESRPFLPHVTVARVRCGARVRAVALEPPSPASFMAERVTLYRSVTASGGAHYELLHSASL